MKRIVAIFVSLGCALAAGLPAREPRSDSDNSAEHNNAYPPVNPAVFRHAVSDLDGDGREEVAFDFGAAGLWLISLGGWIQVSGSNQD